MLCTEPGFSFRVCDDNGFCTLRPDQNGPKLELRAVSLFKAVEEESQVIRYDTAMGCGYNPGLFPMSRVSG